MATPTFELIQTTTLSSNSSNVTFSSIPQTFRDLVLVMNISGVSTNRHEIRYNNDSSSIYNYVVMGASGSTPQGYGELGRNSMNYGNLSVTLDSDPVLHIHQCFDYSATDKHKPTIDRLNQGNSGADFYCFRYGSTNAVTRIDIFPDTGNIASGSTLSLYGIAS